MTKLKIRKNSIALAGGAYGDEGKGKLTDKYVNDLAKKFRVIVYRDNGGANAGHTVVMDDGRKIALHLLPSGVFTNGVVAILGKGMVLHPADLIMEINEAKKFSRGKLPAKLMVDEMAVLSLDTHRAFEGVLKTWEEGGRGSTCRGISPAYADVLLRHPLRMRDLKNFTVEKFKKHYDLYQALIRGLGMEMSKEEVASAVGTKKVGSFKKFLSELKKTKKDLDLYVADVTEFLKKSWGDNKYAFVFEKAQAVGLDPRYGVYPDVTSSDCTFAGLLSSTEGLINPEEIEKSVAVLKATYMSSVGTRIIPTMMEEEWAVRIRDDANEYGATTKRPRGIAYLDLPTLKFFTKVNKPNCLALTHMDIVYPNWPIKICVGYEVKGKRVDYRPDQEFLNKVKPIYKELSTWNREEISQAKTWKEMPLNARKFIKFLEKEIGVPVLMVTNGPKRSQNIFK